ncbi:hypothetical protein [Halorientalis halophila]|uniref:hypothetical protein n=1 Tax=Halorientalis halophila TaxID=3108499 RepID=UPI0030083583
MLDQARQQAADSRGEGGEGAGQIPLTDHEKGEIDFSNGRANVMHARSTKGIARSEGVDDWLAYYDPQATVDEHREIMAQAATEGGGKRREDTETADEKAGRYARTAQGEQCDRARGFCKEGEPDACEFLQSRCGLSESETHELLREAKETTSDDQQQDQQIEGAAAGALSRSWSGYKGAVRRLAQAVEAVEQSWTNAQQAAKAINSIREAHDQQPIHFDVLESAQADLLDFARQAAADCHECHADHEGHDHPTDGEIEDLTEAVVPGDDQQPDQQREAVIETDDQQTLAGERANDQARLAGGEQGEQGQGEAVETVEENPGGIMADERGETSSDGSTEQQVPDEFRVAEGGQETL